jgi:hypothetical protein
VVLGDFMGVWMGWGSGVSAMTREGKE